MPPRTAPTAALLLAAAPALAQVPDAGPDQVLAYPTPATLAGSVSGGAALEWWTADGNGVTENYLVQYSSATGLAAVGPLRTQGGTIYGFPGDLVRVGADVYGIDVGLRKLYTLDATTGIVRPVGSAWSPSWSDVECLAYDPAGDLLYAVDRPTGQLLSIDRATGVVTPIGSQTLFAWPAIRSLAWRESDGMLYAVDQASDWLVRVDPATGAGAWVVALPSEPTRRIEELQFAGDTLYAMNAQEAMGSLVAGRLQRLRLTDGHATNLGPEVLDVSPHCLMVESLPEPVVWTKISGPGSVSFDDREALDATATFSAPGAYVLRLTVVTGSGPVWDEMEVVQDGCPNDPNKIVPGTCGCGVPDDDGDGDGLADCVDNCPGVPNAMQQDTDGDGVGDACDNCLTLPNANQADCDGDMLGDVCEIANGEPDCNGNDVPDACDIASGASLDVDMSTVPDECELPGGSPYCFGDGSGTACPCGNDVPGGTPTGCANSTGFGASLSGSGTLSVSADTFVLAASGAPPNVLGIVFQGKVNAAGGAGVIFADGLRCLQGSLLRIAAITASPAGGFTYPTGGATPISVKGQVPAAGGLRYYQIIHRNFAGPCGGHLNTTSGLAVVWGP